ncbi:MAG: hypothetical protein KBS89_00645 [Bacteroidales bacterium]|nr:hypothetical protein [Candidatus Egerieousia equi]
MKRIITLMCILMLEISANAQTTPNSNLAQYIKFNYGYSLPFTKGVSKKSASGHTIQMISNSCYDGKFYYDNQCQRYDLASSNNEYSSYMYASFKIPGSNYYLSAIRTECGAGFYYTDVLLIVDSQGRIYDELCCKVDFDCFALKQYSIDSDRNITVYSLKPSDYQSLSMWDAFSSYRGYREDRIYKVQGNRFVLTSTIKGEIRTIRPSDFKAGQWNFWDPYWKINTPVEKQDADDTDDTDDSGDDGGE